MTPPVIQVEDRLERRIRKPVDALRCIVSCAWIVVALVAAVAASAATRGVETDIVGASRRLPQALLAVVPPIAFFALLILPIGLAVSQLVRRQVRRLIEAVATGLVAGAAAQVANIALQRPAGSRLYYSIIMSHPGGTQVDALDPYLAGLVAYATMIGLTGRPGWRNALGLAVGVYAVVELAALHTTGLSILITLLAGRAIGLAVRYAAGSASQRPTALAIATALSAGGLAVTAIRRVGPPRPGCGGIPVLRGDDAGRQPARRGGVRPGPAGGRHVLPAVPVDPGAWTGGAHRAAVARPHGRAQGPALLRGQGSGRAHARGCAP